MEILVMAKERLSSGLFKAIKLFERTGKYQSIIDGLSAAYIEGDIKEFNQLYKVLPTERELLEKLLKKLKKKSIYTGLKKVLEGKDQTIEQQKIALSSLFTHIVIEEKKNPEYIILEKTILNKLKKLVSK